MVEKVPVGFDKLKLQIHLTVFCFVCDNSCF